MIKFAHFGEIQLEVMGTEGGADIPLLVLRKAPLKYHDKDELPESKVKCDAVFAFIHDDWKHCGNLLPADPDPKTGWIISKAIEDAILAAI